jgi:hypothetical protein
MQGPKAKTVLILPFHVRPVHSPSPVDLHWCSLTQTYTTNNHTDQPCPTSIRLAKLIFAFPHLQVE